VKEGIKNIQIGMAHRGRLNVLTHVLEKPYEMMISEFMHTPSFAAIVIVRCNIGTSASTPSIEKRFAPTKFL
jgi:2-oxoglutarate dehydrogenase complex dehydrogenase (E1) component-like enzyme